MVGGWSMEEMTVDALNGFQDPLKPSLHSSVAARKLRQSQLSKLSFFIHEKLAWHILMCKLHKQVTNKHDTCFIFIHAQVSSQWLCLLLCNSSRGPYLWTHPLATPLCWLGMEGNMLNRRAHEWTFNAQWWVCRHASVMWWRPILYAHVK